MSDIMHPIPFERLMDWIWKEKRHKGTIFGVRKFYHAKEGQKLSLFQEKLETPIGPAAGPATQLSQNIIAAYAAGSRFFELKTVQVIDGEDLPVGKPCIDAGDECYNTEWSTELRVQDAFDEYVKAWFAIHLIAKEFRFGDPDGFIFNMSVGYDYDGITTPKIDQYIEGMKDAKDTDVFRICKAYALAHMSEFTHIDKEYIDKIPSRISDSITLSTLHGCPPTEIEKIASYLLQEKNLNTFVKCNPTLLGYEFARKTLDEMGFNYVAFGDFHFKDDLQYEDAVPMLMRLQSLADKKSLTFGVKLTNTFPVDNPQEVLAGEEMYMSGRSLYPLSIALAERLTKEFNGGLKISYSGGADYFNIEEIIGAGIWPVTMATTILKPGGYNRIKQIANKINEMSYDAFQDIKMDNLSGIAVAARTNPHHTKSIKPLKRLKIDEKVPLTNCFLAPCKQGCPIHQDIPSYVALVGEGKYLDALRVITDKNPLPFITGTICNHRCMGTCTRNFYEQSVLIRDVKLEAANRAYDTYIKELPNKVMEGRSSVAIIGGGPAGIAAASFLGRCGITSTIFERKDSLGGVVKHVIPEFRISTEAISKDIALMEKMGVTIKLNTEISSIEELKAEGFTYIIFATGAWIPADIGLEKGKVIDVLEFLENSKKRPETINIGKHVVILGAGNTAMDAARAAKRLGGVEKVTIVYRRTKKYMLADEEELNLAIEEGIEFAELLAPKSLEDGMLTLAKVVLGEPDVSGRRSPTETEERTVMLADTVIAAIGEKVDTALYKRNGIEVNKNVFGTNEANIYVIGDALRGPATVVEAIADANRAAMTIAAAEKKEASKALDEYLFDHEKAADKKGLLLMAEDVKKEANRCLACHEVCEACVDVCPNRANIAITVSSGNTEILHMDGMCNECGNCRTFCPYDSAPYQDKLTYFNNREDLDHSNNPGFTFAESGSILIRLDGRIIEYSEEGFKKEAPADIAELIQCFQTEYSYMWRI